MEKPDDCFCPEDGWYSNCKYAEQHQANADYIKKLIRGENTHE